MKKRNNYLNLYVVIISHINKQGYTDNVQKHVVANDEREAMVKVLAVQNLEITNISITLVCELNTIISLNYDIN